MKISLSIGLIILISFSCKKDAKNPEPEAPEPVPAQNSSCKDLPPAPQPFGWYDSTIDENTNINAFIMNPVSPDEVICIVNGDASGYNKMYNFNLITKNSKYLATTSNFLPSINKDGWIVYNTLDNNIFKIKANGDSLRQLTTGNHYFDPKWDYTGKNIFYYQEAFINASSSLIRVKANGAILNNIPVELAHTTPFRASDKIIYLRTSGNVVTLVQRDMIVFEEKDLISGPYDAKAKQIYFDDLTLDNTDENMYWSNSFGIFKCNLKTLHVDTVLKNCPNLIYLNPIISYNANELTVSCHSMTPLNSYQLYHEYKAMEMDLNTGKLTEKRIFH